MQKDTPQEVLWLHEKVKIGLTYFINETGVELDDGDDYRRLQLDCI